MFSSAEKPKLLEGALIGLFILSIYGCNGEPRRNRDLIQEVPAEIIKSSDGLNGCLEQNEFDRLLETIETTKLQLRIDYEVEGPHISFFVTENNILILQELLPDVRGLEAGTSFTLFSCEDVQ